ncbi:MAG: hypothetical protein Q4B68_03180 [Bacteroidales bacterium]|nr:hypothetical protein [Bacteroidales bacterium]
MNLQSWILLIVVVTLLGGVLLRLFHGHKRGRGGCSCCSKTTCPIKHLKATKK